MATPFLLMGNWKMNGNPASWAALAQSCVELCQNTAAEVVLCPPFPALSVVGQAVQPVENMQLGAQNVAAYEKGAYTGEVSAEMLKEMSCTYVLIGHSERRQFMAENDAVVRQKVSLCLQNGLIPVLCIGESLPQKETGQTKQVLLQQLQLGLEHIKFKNATDIVLAYEPVWAIGTGKAASEQEIADVFNIIRAWLVDNYAEMGYKVRILYGGSVTAENAKTIAQIPGVSGVLVGGASLKPESFAAIAKAIEA